MSLWVIGQGRLGVVVVGAALMSLSPPLWEDQVRWEAGRGGAIPKGPSGGQRKTGASRSGSVWVEGLLVGEHVPDRFGLSRVRISATPVS